MKTKKRLIIFVILITIFSILSSIFDIKTYQNGNTIALKNIEALADNEDTTNHACYGYGDIDCFGIKAKLRIDIFSLD